MKKENTSKIINSYAEALYEVAEKQGESEKVFSDVSFLVTELSGSKKKYTISCQPAMGK